MKGTEWNGDYVATKGMTRSDGRHMFSVGGLVAFDVTTFSSPDGRSFSYGCTPTASSYILQEEILLEEFNRTEIDPHYHCGNMDVQKIVELRDEFWHVRRDPISKETFLLGVLDTSENIFAGFISGEITEVRNHPGKFLHIYEIPEGYRGCKGETFEATVDAINLQKKQEDEHYDELVAKNWRGMELVFGITASGWYASRASFGRHGVQRQHEHDSTTRNHHTMVISPEVPCGDTDGHGCSYRCFYLPDGTPMSLALWSNREPSIDTLTDTHWANSQSWHYSEIQTMYIKPGWIIVDGVDVYDCTKQIIDKNRAEQAALRKTKFAEAKAKAIEAGFTEAQTGQIIKLAMKGKVIAMLSLAARLAEKHGTDFALQVFVDLKGKSPVVTENYAFLLAHASEIKLSSAKRAAERAGAWSYLQALVPGYGTGYFDDAMTALQLALANGVPFAELKSESDLAIKLREATTRGPRPRK